MSSASGSSTGPLKSFDRGVEAAADVIRLGIRPFAAPPGQPRSRRATDVVLLVPTVLALAFLVAAYPPSSLELALIRLLDTMPRWLDSAWGFFADLVGLWAIVVFVATLVSRRFSIAGQTIAALVGAVGVGLLTARIAGGSWPDAVDAALDRSRDPDFPDVRLAAAVAALGTISPHLVRPLRTVGGWVALLGLLGAGLSAVGTPAGALSAFLIGVIAASIANLVLGTSAGRPGIGDVKASLARLGVPATDLVEEDRQVAGVLRLRATGADGRPLLVKVVGRDAADNQLVQRVWRTLWYRGSGPAIGSSRLHAVEREAFVTLLVRQAGLPTRDVVTAGTAVHDDALLVLAGSAVPLASFEPVDDDMLRAAWEVLGHLGELRVAHQRIDPETIALVDGAVGFVDFGSATVSPGDEQLAVDRAQLLATTASLAGADRALAAALAAIGDEGIASLLPYLQDAAFSSSLRRSLKKAEIDVDALREEASRTVGTEPPELVNLRRVSWRSAIQIALLGLASYSILSAASGVDWGEARTSLSDATWAWIVAAFLVAQLPRFTQAISTLGSVPAQLPLGPVYAMQLATGYMNVALPSNLARLAVNIRFFQRQGLSSATAVASGAIDSFASTLIQAALLGLLLLFSESSVALDIPIPSGDPRLLLWIVAALVVGSIFVLVTVPRLRNGITERASQWWPDVKATLRALRGGHKLAQLVLGSLATELMFAIALGLFARGFGYDIPLAELLLINLSISLLGTLVPVPGNIGVAEFGLTVGLTGAGMTPEAALGAVFLYRISTFYLPPLWGFVSLRWLQRNRYL